MRLLEVSRESRRGRRCGSFSTTVVTETFGLTRSRPFPGVELCLDSELNGFRLALSPPTRARLTLTISMPIKSSSLVRIGRLMN